MSIWSDLQDRSSGEVTRKEDAIDEFVFAFNVEVAASLEQKVYGRGIKAAAESPFDLGEFTSLEDMLKKLGVTLKISDDTPKRIVPTAISEWKLYWENELKRLEGQGIKEGRLHAEADEEAKKASAEAENWSQMPLLGRYDRFSKKILLFPNNMMEQDREKYLVITFVHEAMHAYFDRHHHELFPYVATVEEPLAEFGMLLFLKETNFKDPDYKWAYDMAKNKKTCYRYGAAMMDFYLNGDLQIRKDLENYKRKLF